MISNVEFLDLVCSKYSALPVNMAMSPDDAMFHGDQDVYLRVGLTALHAVESAAAAAMVDHSQVKRILDFGCGHGRVLRVLRAAFPDASITAADILEPATEFCAQTFGATPLVTSDDFEGLQVGDGQYDLIWLGSIFTHLNRDQFIALLRTLRAGLASRGLLVFTIGGAFVSQRIRGGEHRGVGADGAAVMLEAYESTGFGFAPYSGWTRPWGRAIAKPTWVADTLEAVGLNLILYIERGWCARQNVVAVHRW